MPLTLREQWKYEEEKRKIEKSVEDLVAKINTKKDILTAHNARLSALDLILGNLTVEERDAINGTEIITNLRAERLATKDGYEEALISLRSDFGEVRAKANANPLFTQEERDAVTAAKNDEV